MDIGRLTEAEKLFLWRRRLGLTQMEAAIKLGVSTDQIWTWEDGNMKIPMPTINVVSPNDVEICVLKRRRANMTQKEVAKQLKVSRLWVNKMESGDVSVDRLVSFWS